MLFPGTYLVSVSMCKATSPEIKITVSYGAKVLNQIHPSYEDEGVDPDCIDYGDAPNHVTSAHFNLYWALE